VEDSARVYVIGHPRGGTLSISLQDNLLLDHESPRIHYRTPTEGGSSGGPVFNRQWDLIGLHHAGSAKMQMLNKKQGTYAANEGISIQAIIQAIAAGGRRQ
jgi:V8-like Glu-specific endopeptidase